MHRAENRRCLRQDAALWRHWHR